MPRYYSFYGSDAGGAAPQTLLGLTASTTATPSIFDIVVGSKATPADYSHLFVLQRYTIAPTNNGATTIYPVDPKNIASTTTAVAACSAEGTYTALSYLLQIPLNQRATFRYVASPGAEFISAATAAGIGLRRFASSTAAVCDGTVLFFE